jgi:hypothetical protein
MIYQKQLDNVEYFDSLGSLITNDARRKREIKYGIAMVKGALNVKKNFFTSKLDLKFREGIVKVLHLEYSFVWC